MGQGDVHDVTPLAAAAVADSGLRAGIVTGVVIGSTAGITTLEFESGVIAEIGRALEIVAPRLGEYEHHVRWHDDNGSSHVRTALIGPSVTIPFVDGRLLLGTWQQVGLVELDTRGRKREVVAQVMGEYYSVLRTTGPSDPRTPGPSDPPQSLLLAVTSSRSDALISVISRILRCSAYASTSAALYFIVACARRTDASARFTHSARRTASPESPGASVSVRSSHFCLAFARAFHSSVCNSNRGV
jgi:secondary thiamine-phosphate synthase enzyme